MEKRKPGRPPSTAPKLLRVAVTLDPETVRKGRDLGKGSLSLGIRLAIAKIVLD